MADQIRAPKGVVEYVPPGSSDFLAIRQALLEVSQLAGFHYVELPVFEDTQLYVRGVGESTDVVSKEMYTFEDRGGRSLTLRPEGTAGLVRSVIENSLDRGPLPVKLSYAGPFFRAERPQKGRYRQFHQFGIEAIGSQDPSIDAEVISVAVEGFRSIGITDYKILINSLGDVESREAYRSTLVEYLADFDLDEPTRDRLASNPLRILDDKRPEMKPIIDGAPTIEDSLTVDAREHFDAVKHYLDALNIEYTVEPKLVRGLDYYLHTTFEFVHARLGAQSAIGGGGRYDGLQAQLGGQDLGGVGFGLGIDRLILAAEAEGVELSNPSAIEVFVVPMDAESAVHGLTVASALRAQGVVTELSFDQRSLKSALRHADRAGANFAVLVQANDFEAGTVSLKNLQEGTQENLEIAQIVDRIKGEQHDA